MCVCACVCVAMSCVRTYVRVFYVCDLRIRTILINVLLLCSRSGIVDVFFDTLGTVIAYVQDMQYIYSYIIMLYIIYSYIYIEVAIYRSS